MLEKYLIDIKYVSSFAVLTVEGIVGIINCFIWMAFLILFPNFFYFDMENMKTFLFLLFGQCKGLLIYYGLIAISLLFYHTFSLLTIQNFYPTYVCFSYIFGGFFNSLITYLISYIVKKSIDITLSQFMIRLALYFIMMIGLVIYLEIIQLNVCGLGDNTVFSISLRSESYYMKKMNGITLIYQSLEDDECE